MKLNRLVIGLFIVGSAVFASFYGGNISYAFFYLSILTPIIAFLYTVYVYIYFKLHQSMDSFLVVKGDWTPYSFIIANENFITFRNIKVNFLSDKSTIEETDQATEFSLLPSERERLETRIKCNYRGEYYVGVHSIEITDFLYLFTITYPLASKMKAIVYPRIVHLEQLGIAPSQIDVKNPIRHSNMAEEELDTELRKYAPGDNKKRIHWKASAKLRELASRKYHHKPKEEILLFMDLSKIRDDEMNVIIAEDKIIESILAIANYYSMRNTPSWIIYDMEERKSVTIRKREQFNDFYSTCVNIRFISQTPISELIRAWRMREHGGYFYVAATHFITKELYLEALQVLARGIQMCVLFISDDVSDKTKELIEGMKLAGVTVYQIMSDDEIGDVLSKEIIS